tara:strand:- start:20925 stop:22139 length:1215 start_codon:yes stop_codon:yes gene_type:complete
MIRAVVIVLLIVPFFLRAQIELKRDKLSFKELVEWKGVLVIAEDPKGKVNYKELSRISPEGEVLWRKLIYPKSDQSYLIQSSNSDYIYFVDDLEPYNNTIRYNQINESGSVTPTKLNILNVIRSYGYRTPDDVVVENIVNTPNALVFHLTLAVDDIVENFFVTITHHNNRVYHWKGPETHPDLIKENKEGHILYAGCDEESIYFARYTFQANNHRINFIPFDAKAKPLNAYNYSIPDFNPIQTEERILSNEARYYINKDRDPREVKGIPVYVDNKHLYIVNDSELRTTVVYGANEAGEIDRIAKGKKSAEESRKYDSKLGINRSNNGFTIFGQIEDTPNGLSYGDEKYDQLSIPDSKIEVIRNNPSSIARENKSTTFVYPFSGKWYGIEKSSLTESEIITFKKL